MIYDGERKYKTVRIDNGDQFFYKKDTLGNWVLYFQWEEEPNERYYYKINPDGERVLLFRNLYVGDTIYSYAYDTLGVEVVDWTTIYYYENIPTSSMRAADDSEDINVYVENSNIIVSSTIPVEKVDVIDLDGRITKQLTPHKNKFYVKTVKGFYIVKLKTINGFFYKKVVVY
jgi:hypothetical protein